MQLAQVEGFVEVSRRGNVTRAAEALFITQPALTARIRALEDEVGAKLFRRGTRGMTLTDAGRALLPYAERALSALRSGAALVGQFPSEGEVVVGAAPAVSTYVLPALLVRFVAEHPQVRLVVRTGHSEDLVDMTVRSEVDIALVRAIPRPELELRELYEDELVLVAEPGHPLGRRRHVRIDELREARLILFDRTSSYYELTSALFRQAGALPRGVMELDNIDAAKQMVLAGLGVALLPATSVAAELAAGSLRPIHLIGAPPIHRRIVGIRRREDGPEGRRVPLSPPAEAFWALLDGVGDLLPRHEGSSLA